MSKHYPHHHADLEQIISQQCPFKPTKLTVSTDLTYQIHASNTLALLQWLKESMTCQFNQLIDITAVDYLHYGESEWKTDNANTGYSRATTALKASSHPTEPDTRFVVVYQLLSTVYNWRIRIHALLNKNPPETSSITTLWPNANWLERETYDMFGIVFHQHPDLRRILTDYGFKGYPFRKDFPLIGRTEMRYDAREKRVVYQPVTIENRVSVGKTIRDDSRYTHSKGSPEQ